MSYFSNAERAEVLVQALPYIKSYNGKIVVIKYGGNAMLSEALKEQVMEDIVLLTLVGKSRWFTAMIPKYPTP